jgi:hypothetical protein
MSLIPATPSRGKMRLMIKDKSGVSAAVFIAFLQRLIAGARGVIFLIVDRGPAHAAKKTRAFGERVKGRDRYGCFIVHPFRQIAIPTRWCGSIGRPIPSDAGPSRARMISKARRDRPCANGNPPAKIRSLYQ